MTQGQSADANAKLPDWQTTDTEPETFKLFDYLIVGGGAAGLACAARLSDDPNVSVGVLEAGPWRPKDSKISVPAMMGQALMNPSYDWCFESVPQKSSDNRRWALPRGKMLGGSTALNFYAWQRGFRQDFDDIARLGNPGWDWDSLTPLYMSLTKASDKPLSELQVANGAILERTFHGKQGPIELSHAIWYSEAQKAWWDMLVANGADCVGDGSGSGQTRGLWNTLLTVNETGSRVHAGSAFFEQECYRKRQNLRVLTNAHVLRIEIERPGAQARATGVSFLYEGSLHYVQARREIIVSAGTYLSPQILELSGIGDPQILQSHGIKVAVPNIGVGRNLQEHINVPAVYETTESHVTYDKLKNEEFAKRAGVFFSDDRANDTTGGILGTPCVSGVGYSSLQSFMSEEELEDLQNLANMAGSDSRMIRTDGMRSASEMQLKKLFDPRAPAIEQALLPAFFSHVPQAPPKDTAGYLTSLTFSQYPLSRGSVHIQSNDAREAPVIDPCFFANRADKRLLAYALRAHVAAIEESVTARKVFVHRVLPSPSLDVRESSIEQWEAYIASHAGTTYHPIGTCAMFAQEQGGVVDSALRVYGTENIRGKLFFRVTKFS